MNNGAYPKGLAESYGLATQPRRKRLGRPQATAPPDEHRWFIYLPTTES